MEIKRAAELLRGLADGRDPITGARLPDESVYNHPEIIRALHCVLQELQTRQTVAQAVNAGRSWRPDEEQQLLEEYDAGLPVEQIATAGPPGPSRPACPSSAAATRSSSTCAEDPPMEAKQTKLELALQQELLQNAQQAAALYHSPVTRFVRDLQSRGSVAAVPPPTPSPRWSRPGIWSFRRKPPSSRPVTAPSSPTKRSTPASRSCWKPDISESPPPRRSGRAAVLWYNQLFLLLRANIRFFLFLIAFP